MRTRIDRRWPGLLLGAVAAGAVNPASAQQAQAARDIAEEVIVTGTRERGLTVGESISPIAVVGARELERTGESNVLAALERLIPAYNRPAFPGGDLSNLVHSARLRGLSPNHTLVLVNGRRRHASSVVNATPGPAQGSSPADLALIPVAAIERIEVLSDGAAAQYGSDAIAGVLNIILKSGAEGASFSTDAGAYYKGDGERYGASANTGIALGERGFLNLSADYREHQPSDRTGPDPRVVNGDPNVSKVVGDPASEVASFAFNSSWSLDAATDLYSFGTYANRRARSFQNYRLATDIPAPYFGTIYPNGYIPRERIDEDDYAVTVGVRGETGAWQWDLASTYGADEVSVGVDNSINRALLADTGSSPTQFHSGDFRASQWTTNLDLRRELALGFSEPLTLALGAEYRRDSYKLRPGDPASRYKEGTVAFPGFSETDAGDHSRSNVAAYIDLAQQLTSALKVDLAARYEDYQDSGDTTTGKLSLRYEVTPRFAIRGTASTGFAAPTLQQQYFSTTNVGPAQALVQLPANSPAAAIIGARDLEPEKSRNYSIGLVFNPFDHVSATLDAYRIDIERRIVNTGYLIGPQAEAAITANGNVLGPGVFAAASYFTNAVDTRSEGIDVNVAARTELDAWGTIDWTLGANFSRTTVEHVDAPPPELFSLTSVFDPPSLNALTKNAPNSKIGLGALYRNHGWSVQLRETRYGSLEWVTSSTYVFPPFYTNRITPKYITDLEIGYDFSAKLQLTVGAANLFDVYPNKTIPESRDRNTVVYNFLSPFGYNGGAYYARLNYRL